MCYLSAWKGDREREIRGRLPLRRQIHKAVNGERFFRTDGRTDGQGGRRPHGRTEKRSFQFGSVNHRTNERTEAEFALRLLLLPRGGQTRSDPDYRSEISSTVLQLRAVRGIRSFTTKVPNLNRRSRDKFCALAHPYFFRRSIPLFLLGLFVGRR